MNVYVRELCRQLGRKGISVDIYTRQQEPDAPLVKEIWPGVRIIHLPAGPIRPYPKGEVYNHLPEFTARLRRFVAEDGVSYDILHSHYWLSGWVARELQREWGVPIIHMFHTLGRMKDAVARTPAEREVDIRERVEQEIMSFADRIVAATPLDKEQMLRLYEVDVDKISIIPCGVDLDMFHPIPRQEAKRYLGGPIADRKMVLFVGRLDPVKGLDTLLEALCELTHRNPDWAHRVCLAVIGGDAESASEALNSVECLDDLKVKFDLSDLVIFLGSRAQDTLAYYYSAAEVCVMPSRYESFGMVALEAMACGTPVIASRVGGLMFTVQDQVTGFLVPEGDPKALAAKLELILVDPELRNRLGQQALAAAQCFTWENVATRMMSLYDQTLKKYAFAPGAPSVP